MLAAARSRLHYGWVVFVLSLGNLTIEGGTKNSESVYFHALKDSFGRSATYTSAVFSTAGLIGALSAPFLGILLDRWGARVLLPLAGLCILFGWVASSYAADLWQMFIFYGIFSGIGHTGISSFSMTATLAPWFPQTRGRMLGLADSGNPIGQAIFAPPGRIPGDHRRLALGLPHLRRHLRRDDRRAQRPAPAPRPGNGTDARDSRAIGILRQAQDERG